MWPYDHLPTWATMPATVFIIGIAIIRPALTPRTSIFGSLINTALGLDAVAAILREPVIALQVARVVPGGLPTVFDTWHWLTVTAWACGLGMVIFHEYGRVHFRIRFKIVIALSVAVGVVFLALSSPARAHGMASIADYGGWRYGVYIGLYSTLPVVVSCYLVVLKHRATGWRTTTLWERIMVAAVVCFGVAHFLPVCLLVVSAALAAAGVGSELTHRIYDFVSDGLASGEPGLFVFTALVVVLARSAAQAVAQLLRLDRDSRTARRLYPLWRDLTAAAPQVVFRPKWADDWNASSQERLYRRRIEIHDAAQIVARYVLPLPAVVDELIETAVPDIDQEDMRMVAELVMAAERLAGNGGEPADEPTVCRADVPDQQILLRLWQPAKRLLLSADLAAETPTAA
ncbi:DUF6545 domain-containing protein [Nocardia transvalensis]|uniref:DUF6545 domain-containing protein n=1 Tax=Nocardia transvalensis TaxID=37333 RepID=UPI001895685D|nr:DUF6545 domain-containing protein [Nocardia transvalensis]MBF6328233.1 hypothetical protein [Nocardia transvalensis]